MISFIDCRNVSTSDILCLGGVIVNNIKITTHLAQWGNSKAVRLPSEVIRQLALDANQPFTVTSDGKSIILTPDTTAAPDIHDLFCNWQDDGKREQELDWGPSTGEELPW